MYPEHLRAVLLQTLADLISATAETGIGVETNHMTPEDAFHLLREEAESHTEIEIAKATDRQAMTVEAEAVVEHLQMNDPDDSKHHRTRRL